MKYVNLNATMGALTGVISPASYLEHLPMLADALPVGARAFATDPDHFDFSGKRCVKDLELEQVRVDGDGNSPIELRFRHNCWKHDEDLLVRYEGVSGFDVDTPNGPDWTQFGPVILDEILPNEHGCTHEVPSVPGPCTSPATTCPLPGSAPTAKASVEVGNKPRVCSCLMA